MPNHHSDYHFVTAPLFAFPDPVAALKQHQDGLIALSLSLTPKMLLNAYRRGIFPWFEQQGIFAWFAVDPRTVLFPQHLHISKSLRKTLRQKSFKVTVNQAFAQVIHHCAHIQRGEQNSSWISPAFEQAYTQLHQQHRAHSVECWYPNEQGEWELAGGFYGVQIGSVFYGESMFALQPDASKIAFACAVPYLAECGIKMIDCQQDTAHLARFGSESLPFTDFLHKLQQWTVMPLIHPIQKAVICEVSPIQY